MAKGGAQGPREHGVVRGEGVGGHVRGHLGRHLGTQGMHLAGHAGDGAHTHSVAGVGGGVAGVGGHLDSRGGHGQHSMTHVH